MIHRQIAETVLSWQLSFRRTEFSETEFPVMRVLGNSKGIRRVPRVVAAPPSLLANLTVLLV